MAARWFAFLVWAAVAASALYWGLRVFVRPAPVPAHAVVAVASAGAGGDLTRLLGATAGPASDEDEEPEPVADARFQLIGVVAPRSAQASGEGLALISVDGKPPRAYRVGATVDGEQVLQAVRARGATLGPRGGAAAVALEIPPPAPASTGRLPAAGAPTSMGMPLPGGLGQPGRPIVGAPTARLVPPGARWARPQPVPAPAQGVPADDADAAEPLAADAVQDGVGAAGPGSLAR